MVTTTINLTPKPHFLLAEQNAKWTVHGAVSELVDNGFGEARGNATQVIVAYDRSHRLLHVVDNGVGMDDLSRLFQLGNTIGVSPNDIGIFGAGGTKALLWLGAEVEVWSVYKGDISHTKVVWDDLRQFTDLSQVNISVDKTPLLFASGVPQALQDYGTGTYIQIKLADTRVLTEDTVKRELAKTYAPAILQGKHLYWGMTVRGSFKKGRMTQLSSPFSGFTKSVKINSTISHFNTVGKINEILTIEGEVGIVPDLSTKQCRVSFGFGPRVVFSTTDCYGNGKTYDGKDICGLVQLRSSSTGNWHSYLSTMKDGINDAVLRAKLMDAVYKEITALLEETKSKSFKLEFEQISMSLKAMFGGKRTTVLANSKDVDDKSKTTTRLRKEDGGTGGGTTKERVKNKDPKPREDKPGHKEDPNGANENRPPEVTSIEIIPLSDKRLEAQLCEVELVNDVLQVKVNEDHEAVIEAMKAKPINQMALNLLICREIAAKIGADLELCEAAFGKAMTADLEKHDEDERRKRAVFRILMDKVRGQSVAA